MLLERYAECNTESRIKCLLSDVHRLCDFFVECCSRVKIGQAVPNVTLATLFWHGGMMVRSGLQEWPNMLLRLEWYLNVTIGQLGRMFFQVWVGLQS